MHKIFIYDEFCPEDIAMMQALYSRSQSSVENHVEKVKETGSGKFMEKFYVGYGHKSIADCGSTTAFIEQVSMLAAKAIQDWPLYSGQESSTRYIDYANQPIVDPIGTAKSKQIQQNWMDFYFNSQKDLIGHLKQRHPKKETDKKGTYNRAIKARSFDILRGFLPAGVTTQLSWHTNLRQGWDKLSLLIHHPLPEISEIAKDLLKTLQTKYPNSFSHRLREDTNNYHNYIGSLYSYFDPEFKFSFSTTIDPVELEKYSDITLKRPPKTNLPHFLSDLGLCNFTYLIDFGSFRDLQRHRNGICRMPLLTTKHGFNTWYLDQLPASMCANAMKLINNQIDLINSLECTAETKQYYTGMGFNIVANISYGLPATVYVIELRSGKTVHPTLRARARQMYFSLRDAFPELTMHPDLSPGDWDVSRGNQSIFHKNSI
jgi:thymidylate synthase ThyX